MASGPSAEVVLRSVAPMGSGQPAVEGRPLLFWLIVDNELAFLGWYIGN